MYLSMYLIPLLGLLCTFGIASSPALRITSSPPEDDAVIEKRSPQRNPAADVVTTLITIGETMYEIVSDVLEDSETTEREFVRSTLDELQSRYDENILMFHNLDSRLETNEEYRWTDVKVDLEDLFDTSKSYKVVLLRRGTFHLAGDGGERNWGYRGCERKWEDENGIHIRFFFGPDECSPGGPNDSENVGAHQQYGYLGPLASLILMATALL